jgi:hypothetical protein
VVSAAAGGGHDTLMWEVRAAPGRLPELLAWVERQLADPAAAGAGTDVRADVYTASDDRIVVILRTAAAGSGVPGRLPDPPAALLARAPHQWPFAFHGHWPTATDSDAS